MPPLIAFGRKWEIGSDDLVYPGIRNLLIRIPWLVGTIVVAWQNYKLDCTNSGIDYVRIFLFGAIGILSLMICGDLLLIYNSSRGGIMDTRERRFVPFCLYVKVALYLIELGWNSSGTYAHVHGILSCDESLETPAAILGLVICNWMLLVFFLGFWIWQYDPFGKSKSHPASHPEIDFDAFNHAQGLPANKRTGQWERRLKIVFCGVLNEGKSEAIQNIYKEAAGWYSYFFLNKDLVLSDTIAGTTLQCIKTAKLRKKNTEKDARFSLTSSIHFDRATNSIQLPPSEDWNSIPSVLHFLNYALAIFTLPGAFCFRRGKFLGALCTKTQCCNSMPGRKSYPIQTEKDNCCYWKTASLRTFVEDEDILYASYDNSEFCCPFFVALDHSTKSIVIVIRGSFSSIDFLVDFDVMPVPMDIKGVPAGFKAHRGMLKVAKTVKKELDRLEFLMKLTKSHPDYKILVTGISLGAGVSAILSIILRQEFQNVRCLAFSVPGCVVSLEAAEYCNDFVTSIVYGDDLVPRLGIPSFNHAISKIQSVLHESHTPKYRIQMGLGCSIFGMGRKLIGSLAEDENIPDQTGAENGYSPTESQSKLLQDASGYYPEKIRAEGLERFRHFPPGKILHVTQTPVFNRKHRKQEGPASAPRWEVKWENRTEFNEIIFSNRMVLDHLPFRLIRALKYFSTFSSKKEKVITGGPVKTQIKMEKG